jgi:hypothetical protein
LKKSPLVPYRDSTNSEEAEDYSDELLPAVDLSHMPYFPLLNRINRNLLQGIVSLPHLLSNTDNGAEQYTHYTNLGELRLLKRPHDGKDSDVPSGKKKHLATEL